MDLGLLLILFIPVIISLICKFVFKFEINWKEFLIQLVVGTLVLSLIWFAGRYSAAQDNEVLNGHVTGKRVDRFSCPTNTMNPCKNGYTCHSHQVCSTTGTGKNRHRSCHEEHDTCYVYSWEQDWYVKSDLGEFQINRVDRQGAVQPDRYSIAMIDDPVSKTHGYKNWVLGASDSLYHQDEGLTQRYQTLLPDYHQEIYDYYKINRVYTPFVKLSNAAAWDDAVSRSLVKLGADKQVNFVVVIVADVSRDYAPALRRKWKGFKKNEAIIFIGLDSNKQIAWGESMSWSKNSIYDVDVRNMIEARRGTPIANVDPVEFMSAVSGIVRTDYVRRPMKEFEYLKGDIPPPTWMLWLASIFAVVFGVGTSFLFHKYEI